MKNKKEVKPNTVCLLMSEGCNLACTYCFETTKANKKISLDVLEASWTILKNNNKQKHATFMIFGGEPTLAPDEFLELVNLVSSEFDSGKKEELPTSVLFSIVTNVVTLPLKFKQALKLINDHPNLDFNIQFSTSCHEEEHNETRVFANGKGSYTEVMSTIKEYKRFITDILKRDIYECCNCHTVITPSTVHFLYDIFINSIEYGTFWFIPLTEDTVWSEADLFELSEQTKKIGRYIINNQDTDKRLKKIMSDLTHTIANDKFKTKKPCGYGDSLVTVDASGTLFECHRFKFDDNSHILSNDILKEKSLTSFSSELHDFDKDPLKNSEGLKCADCPTYDICYICPALNYKENRQENVVSSKACAPMTVYYDALKTVAYEYYKKNKLIETFSEKERVNNILLELTKVNKQNRNMTEAILKIGNFNNKALLAIIAVLTILLFIK